MNRIVLVIVCLSFVACVAVDRGPSIASPKKQSRMLRSSELDEQKVREMISRFGPVIYLHSEEKFFMDDPDYVLDNGVSLNWGEVKNIDNYATFHLGTIRTMATSSQTLLEDMELVKEAIQSLDDSSYHKYWLHIDDSMKKGSMVRAKALVRVLPFDLLTTEIQFWLFYPFNGPGRVEVCASSKMCDDNWLKETGRHYGDWEKVSILVSNNAEELLGVHMSRHSGSDTFKKGNDGQYRSVNNSKRILSFEGFGQDVHPVIYSAISSHAHYHSKGNHNYKRVYRKKYLVGTASADLFDRTDSGQALKTYKKDGYRFVSSDLPNFKVQEPEWLQYDGRWGQHEKLHDKIKWGAEVNWMKIKVFDYKEIGNGPTGPKIKKAWIGDGTFR